MGKPIELMGLTLKNPVLVAAGPWSRDAAAIQRCIDAGASAVITETITLEAKERICPRLFSSGDKLFNTMLYSPLHLEQWETEMERIQRKGAKLICSIWGASRSEIAYLAAKVERMGADAIEVSISAPIGTRNQTVCSHSSDIGSFIKAAVTAVHIPVMVKLSYEAAVSPDFLSAISQAGVAGVSAIDALKGLSSVDIQQKKANMLTYGGYTGPSIRPVSLAATAALIQYTSLATCSVGGIEDAASALQFLMLGATAIQLASAIQLHGTQVISDTISGLDQWLSQHGYSDLEQIRGAALPTLLAYEDIEPKPLTARITGSCTDANCRLCLEGCLYDAVTKTPEGVTIDEGLCSGCGLCADRCPKKLIQIGWV
jgi:dihydroorotate dehydrogenase/NAD-dependent dihydropyrimidine dehydrogenase PreA subunit